MPRVNLVAEKGGPFLCGEKCSRQGLVEYGLQNQVCFAIGVL